MSADGTHHNPLEQFEINYLTNFPEFMGMNLNFSNSSLFMTLAVLIASFFMIFGAKSRAIIPTRFQSVTESFYEFIAKLMKDVTGNKGTKFFPLIFSTFIFVLLCNLLGMMPYSFTVTSHIAVTFALALFIFIIVTITGFVKHGTHYFSLLLPSGTPLLIAPLMVFIELFAYLVRPLSLSIRLSANMLAGHTMLKVFAGFVVSMGVFGVLPLSFMVLLVGFEIFVALLQAYVFTILACVYLNDALNLH